MVPGWLTAQIAVWGIATLVALGSLGWLYEHVKGIGKAEVRQEQNAVIEDRNHQITQLNDIATAAMLEAEKARNEIKTETKIQIKTEYVPYAVPTPVPGKSVQASAPEIPTSIIDKLNKVK